MDAVRVAHGGMCKMQGSRREMSPPAVEGWGSSPGRHSVWAEVCQPSKGMFPEDDMCVNPEASEVQIF